MSLSSVRELKSVLKRKQTEGDHFKRPHPAIQLRRLAEPVIEPEYLSVAKMKAAETFRAREVYRYYQPRDVREPIGESLVKLQVPGAHFLQKTNFTTQQSFSDTALTAFTQLIALRLECQRAIVSLSDHENEYFLAESTSTFGLIGDDGPSQNAWLSISGARVPRSASLCEHTLSLIPNQDTTAEMTPVFLVPDLRLDEKMCELECVRRWDLRFYCGVALTNLKGVNIGCVYVVDDKPRTDFSLEQAQFLTRMAATVMDHLENIRAKEDIVRVTMMSQALHAFIEGDGTMNGDWQRLKRYNLPSGAGVGYHWETNKNDGSGSYSNGKMELGSTQMKSDSEDLSAKSPQDARYNFNNSPWSSTSEIPRVLPLNSVFQGDGKDSLAGGRDAEFSSMGFEGLLHTTFSRASNLVREGMEVDGAVYFDAPYRFYQGRSTLESDVRIEKDVGAYDSSDEEDAPRPGPTPHATYTGSHKPSYAKLGKVMSASNDIPGLKSEILGFSTKDCSSWNNQTTPLKKDFTAIDQSLLTALVRRYPQGELFVFDEDGPISPHSASLKTARVERRLGTVAEEEKRARHKARKRAEIIRLLESFPNARQIFFVPLYDNTSGCFIGSFAWSTSATRIFSLENHHSYLVAFGHSVMSEVSRLNTLSADNAKGDFISNVSHELRSPLHGILASVEFLADSTLDGFQRNLVDTVDICGRTLLDTIEHVLDFSKVKKFGKEVMQPMGLQSDLDISAVIEEVLEGVFAGFEFNGLSSHGLADTTQSHTWDASHLTTPNDEMPNGYINTNDQLSVILDIDFREKWTFPTVPGIWRRLTMNIFGNALKYTPDGFIKIKLEARSISPANSKDGVERSMITLTISDSGKGISPEFLKSKLFMPFSQEDVTQPGTGLGMSIVKQIVDFSGGSVDIRSEVGKGTEVTLSIPLANDLSQSTPKLAAKPEDEGPIEALRRRTRGRTVTIRGFDGVFEDSDLRKASLSSLKASIEKYVTEWFGLQLVTSDKAPDIVISDETAFLSSTIDQRKFRSQLILCSNGARRNIYMSRLQPGQAVEFVSKPCGPHRIAKALLNCLDTEDTINKTDIENRVSDPNGPLLEAITSCNSYPQPLLEREILVTADSGGSTGSKNRLIGDLQSAIGFSPKAPDFNRLESFHKPLIRNNLAPSFSVSDVRRPLVSVQSGRSMDEMSASNATTDASSQIGTVDTSTSFAGDAISPLPCIPEPVVEKIVQIKPKMLLVEDNPVNMMLLATYMTKNGWEYEKAENGLIALQAFQSRPDGFDVIFMDVSMPIMTGYESTRAIRACEAERLTAYAQQDRPVYSPPLSPTAVLSTSFPFESTTSSIDYHMQNREKVSLRKNKPALIIALTGFSSQADQEQAFEAGVDVFMTKPVRFREVGKILAGWMKGREVGESGVGK